jgi:transcriptional regulator with XRE-family HTH domain
MRLLAYYMHIGKAIKNLRQLAELTQQGLADGIGKTKGLICQIEKTGKINYYTLVKIAKILKTTPEKIEQYEQSLANNVRSKVNAGIDKKLPEYDFLRLENQLLKEQIVLLKKNILLLEQKL